MQSLQQKTQHFLGVMLGKTLELDGTTSYYVLYVPWGYI